MSFHFPTDWPANCPPQDAIDADGVVFRLVRNDPPQHKDLESHHESGRIPKAPPCLRCGLSVFRELRDAAHLRHLMPKLGKWIAQATLQANHGKTKLTKGQQPTHTTWWAYDGVQRSTLFTIIQEES